MGTPAKGVLLGDRVLVPDPVEARSLFSDGFFGKPLGVPKPRGPDFDEPLTLDLFEARYLIESGRLLLLDAAGRRIGRASLRRRCAVADRYFEEKYRVYRELRDSGYVVSAGIKFGSDFAVYERGPGIDHAPFLVHVLRPGDSLTANYIILAGRLATAVRKRFILAIVGKRRTRYLAFEWWRPRSRYHEWTRGRRPFYTSARVRLTSAQYSESCIIADCSSSTFLARRSKSLRTASASSRAREATVCGASGSPTLPRLALESSHSPTSRSLGGSSGLTPPPAHQRVLTTPYDNVRISLPR
ncbi:MAG: tRNA-intron lyase [Thaumarchaeota archaeon]|jgi:tRNA-intron endonuclease|nr:tRNA-intron lyase [Nitrososphaerota archaeon]